MRNIRKKTWDNSQTLSIKFRAYCLKNNLKGEVFGYCGSYNTGFRIKGGNAHIEYCPNNGNISYYDSFLLMDTLHYKGEIEPSPSIQQSATKNPFLYDFWITYCQEANTIPSYVNKQLTKILNKSDEDVQYSRFNLYDDSFCMISNNNEDDYVWFERGGVTGYEVDINSKFLYNVLNVLMTQNKLNNRALNGCLIFLNQTYNQELLNLIEGDVTRLKNGSNNR